MNIKEKIGYFILMICFIFSCVFGVWFIYEGTEFPLLLIYILPVSLYPPVVLGYLLVVLKGIDWFYGEER